MGCYGADTPKPSILVSNRLRIVVPLKRKMTKQHMVKFKPQQTTTVKPAQGSRPKQVTGNAELKQTQTYTQECGNKSVDSYMVWRSKHKATDVLNEESSDSDYDEQRPRVDWPEANLTKVIRELEYQLGHRVPGNFLICSQVHAILSV